MGFDGWKINGAEFKWRIDSSASNASPVALEEGLRSGRGIRGVAGVRRFRPDKKKKTKHDNQSCFHYQLTFDFRYESGALSNSIFVQKA